MVNLKHILQLWLNNQLLLFFTIGRFWRRSYSRKGSWCYGGWHCFRNNITLCWTQFLSFNFYKRWVHLYLDWTWTTAFLTMLYNFLYKTFQNMSKQLNLNTNTTFNSFYDICCNYSSLWYFFRFNLNWSWKFI